MKIEVGDIIVYKYESKTSYEGSKTYTSFGVVSSIINEKTLYEDNIYYELGFNDSKRKINKSDVLSKAVLIKE